MVILFIWRWTCGNILKSYLTLGWTLRLETRRFLVVLCGIRLLLIFFTDPELFLDFFIVLEHFQISDLPFLRKFELNIPSFIFSPKNPQELVSLQQVHKRIICNALETSLVWSVGQNIVVAENQSRSHKWKLHVTLTSVHVLSLKQTFLSSPSAGAVSNNLLGLGSREISLFVFVAESCYLVYFELSLGDDYQEVRWFTLPTNYLVTKIWFLLYAMC